MEYLKDIKLDTDEYGDRLAHQQVLNLENKLLSVYKAVKKLITELEGAENAHEKTVWVINSYLDYLKNLQLPDIKVQDNCLKEKLNFINLLRMIKIFLLKERSTVFIKQIMTETV